MAYFLKKTNNKKGTYLQIYSSFYDPERVNTAHKSFKPVGYVHELQAKGIADPIAYYKEEVAMLNQEFRSSNSTNKTKQISEESHEKRMGYFPFKNINDRLSVKKYIDLMQTATDLIHPTPILTVPISILKLTMKMILEEKVFPRKTKKTRLWGWNFCLMQTRYP